MARKTRYALVAAVSLFVGFAVGARAGQAQVQREIKESLSEQSEALQDTSAGGYGDERRQDQH